MDDEIHKTALKAMRLTNYCTKHGLYHGQKYKNCTPQKRVMIVIKPEIKENKMDKELETIIEIEKLIDGMKWEVKQRVLRFVQDRTTYDPAVDGGALGLVANNQSQLNKN